MFIYKSLQFSQSISYKPYFSKCIFSLERSLADILMLWYSNNSVTLLVIPLMYGRCPVSVYGGLCIDTGLTLFKFKCSVNTPFTWTNGAQCIVSRFLVSNPCLLCTESVVLLCWCEWGIVLGSDMSWSWCCNCWCIGFLYTVFVSHYQNTTKYKTSVVLYFLLSQRTVL